MADIGTDVNLMHDKVLQRMISSGSKVHILDLKQSLCQNMATSTSANGDSALIVCERTATFTLELHLRNGSTFVLRNTRWVVTKKVVGEPLLGRPTLEALGLNCVDILGSSAGRLNSETDLSALHANIVDAEEGTVSRLSQGVYHSDKFVEDC